jgi:hypothetical protein
VKQVAAEPLMDRAQPDILIFRRGELLPQARLTHRPNQGRLSQSLPGPLSGAYAPFDLEECFPGLG